MPIFPGDLQLRRKISTGFRSSLTRSSLPPPRNLLAWDGSSRLYYWDSTNLPLFLLLLPLRYCKQMCRLTLWLIESPSIEMALLYCWPAQMVYALCISTGDLLLEITPLFAGLFQLAPKSITMKAMPFVYSKFHGTPSVTHI